MRNMSPWNATLRLYSTTILITILVSGPIRLCGYFPNTAEHVLFSFLEKSLNISTFNTSENANGTSSKVTSPMLNYVWGFFASEIFTGSICGILFCLVVGRKLSTMSYLNLVPLICIPSYILQFFAKPTNCWECLLVGRFVTQIGSGIFLVVGPIFLCEVAGPSQRGVVIMVFRTCSVFMCTVASFLGIS